MPNELPVDGLLADIVARLKGGRSLVLRAPTGAGKTTRVPPALLEFGPVLVVEPRRLAARAAARRIADERGERLAQTVGYHVRFDRQVGPSTRLVVATPGILLRMLHDDAGLDRFAVVAFDEFHERGIESDLGLGMCRLLQETVRPDLRLVAMSATLDVGDLTTYLGCSSLESQGRLFPVDVRHEEPPLREPTAASVADAIRRVADERPGDILAFLPGVGEIRQTAAELDDWATRRDVAIALLYGDLPADRQDAALRSQSRRKVVLATNVAETSVTVEGVAIVVDSGLARQIEFDPAVGMDRLSLVPISRASADQRAGRAGRTGPGLCVRLWGPAGHRLRPEQTAPEIARVDLAGPALQLISLGERDIEAFPWIEPPAAATVERARWLLERLGATRDGSLTDVGASMARLPVHPRLGRLLVEGSRRGIADEAALLAAILSERDPFLREGAASRPLTHSDLADRAQAIADFEASGATRTPFGPIDVAAAKHLLRARDQLARAVRDDLPRAAAPAVDRVGAVDASILAAFPDRLVRRRENDPRRGVMVGGRGVRLAPQSGVVAGELFVALDVDAGDREAIVRMASAVPRDALPADHLRVDVGLAFDEAAERVVARRRLMWDDLSIEETPAHLPADSAVAQALAEAAVARMDRVVPAADSAAGQFLLRVRWLRSVVPELDLPAFDDAELAETVRWLCAGKKSFADLRAADWTSALMSRLPHRALASLEKEAPERIAVPSGSRIALTYEMGKPPTLAVRIQEMFGLADTPRIAGGRVKVLLHLLGPNYRPQQVTDDLASFWANTYPTVRKELRARYPKHSWPDDPLAAPAVRGAKKRG